MSIISYYSVSNVSNYNHYYIDDDNVLWGVGDNSEGQFGIGNRSSYENTPQKEVILSDWVDTIIIPSAEREAFEAIIPYELESRTFFLDNDCKDIWNWSEKVYEFVKNRGC